MSKLLEGYPAVIEVPVAWGEMDAFQHVNNIVFFRYFESARIAYFDRVDMAHIQEVTGVGPILASTHCRFRIPLTYPDRVFVGARVTQVEADRFTMEYCVVSNAAQKVAADGEGVIVAYAYKEKRKALLPEELKQRILALEGI